MRTGIGTFGTLRAIEMLRDLHPDALDDDKIFATPHRHGLAKLLEAASLRVDTQGLFRNAKTIRHTSLMFRFLYDIILPLSFLIPADYSIVSGHRIICGS